MQQNSWFGKLLRFIGIVLMALTAGFTLLAGVGTTCAALFPTRWESMAPLAPFQWLYILFVLTGVAIGIAGIRAVVMLVKGAPRAYRAALSTLIAGFVVGCLHIAASRALRGKSMPVDAVVYTTLLTLIIFLAFRIPAIWRAVNFSSNPPGGKTAGGAALVVCGLFTLVIQYLMASTHTWNGVNYADAFHAAMTVTGWGLALLGTLLLAEPRAVTAVRAVQRR